MQGSTDAQATTHRPRLAFILVTIFLDMAGFGMVAPLLPLYVQRHAGGALLAGALGSVYALMQVFSAPVIGSLADRHGRRPVLVLCLLGSFCAYLGLAFAGSLGTLFAAVAFGGLMGGSYATAQAYIADGAAATERTRWMGLAGAALGLGVAAGPLLGGFLGARGLRIPAFAASGVALGNALFGLVAIRDFQSRDRAVAGRQSLRINPVRGVIDVFRRPLLRPFLLTLAALNLSFSGLPATFPLFSQLHFGWTPSDNGLFFTFIGALAVLTQGLLVGRTAPRFGEARLALTGAAMALAAFPLAATAQAGWVLYPSLGAVAVGTGLAIPSLMSLLVRSAPEAGVGRVMGGVQSVLSACMIAGPALAGTAHQALGSTAPYWMGGCFAAVAFVIVLSGRQGVGSEGQAGISRRPAAAPRPPAPRHSPTAHCLPMSCARSRIPVSVAARRKSRARDPGLKSPRRTGRVPAPSRATASAQKNWSTAFGKMIDGTPARRPSAVVPAPPWCMTALTRGKSHAWEASSMKHIRGESCAGRKGPASPPVCTTARRPLSRRALSMTVNVSLPNPIPMLPNPMYRGGSPEARKRSRAGRGAQPGASSRNQYPVTTWAGGQSLAAGTMDGLNPYRQ